MYYTYILLSLKDYKTYTGYTSDLHKRFFQHQHGRVRATKHRRPFEIMFYEAFETVKEAKNRERWWKSGAGRRQMVKFFKNK